MEDDMGLAGFDFEALNRKFTAANGLVHLALGYGIFVNPEFAAPRVWRCVGIYHLAPSENKGRHNIFIDVLDENGRRIPGATVKWRWSDDAPVQVRVIDKPTDEPGCDIDMSKGGTYSLWLEEVGDMSSDVVTGIHTRHADELGPNGETWNSVGHHSFYVCFQRQRAAVITPPVIDPPTTPLTLEQRVERLEKLWEEMQGGK